MGSFRTFFSEIVVVGAGGFFGASLRYLISGWVQRLVPFSVFPWGTLVVNVLGCLALGFLGGLADLRQLLDIQQRQFLLIGLLGGFTTFSTFAFESYALAQDAAFGKAFLNIALQLGLGLSAAWFGYAVARSL